MKIEQWFYSTSCALVKLSVGCRYISHTLIAEAPVRSCLCCEGEEEGEDMMP